MVLQHQENRFETPMSGKGSSGSRADSRGVRRSASNPLLVAALTDGMCLGFMLRRVEKWGGGSGEGRGREGGRGKGGGGGGGGLKGYVIDRMHCSVACVFRFIASSFLGCVHFRRRLRERTVFFFWVP